MKKTVILRAPLLTSSGYGTHSRQVMRWLLTRKDIDLRCQVVPWGITSWILDQGAEDGLIHEIMARSTPSDQRGDVSIQIQLPNEWDPGLAKKNVGISAFVETDSCNPQWLAACNTMDAIVVPSKHVASCIQNTGGINTPLHVIPESYYDCITNPHLPDLGLQLDTDFNFLVFGQLTGNNPENDRKNIFYTIKWLCETFANDPTVGIVLKTNSGKSTTIDRKYTMDLLRNLANEVRQGQPFPKIHFLHGDFSQEEISSLYRHPKINALLSLTRGEGFGLPLLEAAASGLPVMATAWSGHLDFLRQGKFLDVKYRLVDIHESRVDNQIFLSGAKWAEPIEEDVKKRLIKFRNAADIPKKWALDLREKLLVSHSQENINKIYDDKLSIFFNE